MAAEANNRSRHTTKIAFAVPLTVNFADVGSHAEFGVPVLWPAQGIHSGGPFPFYVRNRTVWAFDTDTALRHRLAKTGRRRLGTPSCWGEGRWGKIPSAAK